MKKFIAMIMLLLIPYLVFSGPQNTCVNVAKKDTVTLNILTESKKQIATNDNLQNQWMKLVENQMLANQTIVNTVSDFGKNITEIAKRIEHRNKDDSLVLHKFYNYSPEKIKKIIVTEKRLNFIAAIFALVFLIWEFGGKQISINKWTAQGAAVKIVYSISMTIVLYVLLLRIITLLFNGDYYVIKELINLYT